MSLSPTSTSDPTQFGNNSHLTINLPGAHGLSADAAIASIMFASRDMDKQFVPTYQRCLYTSECSLLSFATSTIPTILLQVAQSTTAACTTMIPSTSPSATPSDLDAPYSFDPSDTNREVTLDTSSSVDYTGYEGIDWNRISGYCIRKQRRKPRTGWVWEHGFDIEKDGSGRRFWLCKECHRKKAAITHMYDAASTTQQRCSQFNSINAKAKNAVF
ncbi:hypothetical protein B0J13DRAFT_527183 [Dactylonectria estremocensis]|uniref:BED-type domain-containing protein n=1 Tax=Dactylonectria estremocensis TaxID=1079267 RepID=A0A9P9ENQ0_9HYPO|nr:hypothetical protein B0J13DRAFT_527183 [Dactylonectria estremocensis]